MIAEVLADVLARLDELIIAVVATSSGGFIGGWMALRAANSGIARSVAASEEERRAAAIAHRREVLAALEAELRLNAALLASEQADHSPVAAAWRIPFRDAYVTALPYLASLPPAIQRSLQEAAIRSSHYTVVATQHNARTGDPAAGPNREVAQAEQDRLHQLAPDQLRAYLAAAAGPPPGP